MRKTVFLPVLVGVFSLVCTLALAQRPEGKSKSKQSPTPPRAPKEQAPQIVVAAAEPEQKLLAAQFDANHDGQLDDTELKTARDFLAKATTSERQPLASKNSVSASESNALEPTKPGARVAAGSQPVDAKIKTLFLQFNQPDWDAQLLAFASTDLAIHAQLTHADAPAQPLRVRQLWDAGATPRSSYKRSLELTFSDPSISKIVLRAAPTDPTYLRTALYYEIARDHLIAPHAAYVRLVINGEDWGTYLQTDSLDENFLRARFPEATSTGVVWTVSSGGNLAYLGEDPAPYRRYYHLASTESPEAWKQLITLCRLLNETPPDQLETALRPHLDIPSTIRFLALENVLINQSGYRVRAGGYALYLDAKGVFHFIPQDVESSFRPVLMQQLGAVSPEDREVAVPLDRGPAGMSKSVEAELHARENFKAQGSTDLAMLLSYSFVNKADRNDDHVVSRAEMADYARHWFIVMDEDYLGYLTHERFIQGIRNFVTPLSVLDGRTRQTFAGKDPSEIFATDLLATISHAQPDRINRDEFVSIFTRWNDTWQSKKVGLLAQADFQRGLSSLLSESVFTSDQTYIAQSKLSNPQAQSNDREGRGGRDGGGFGFAGIPALFTGRGGRRGSRQGGRAGGTELIFSYEQLDPAAGLDDPNRPLLSKLLKPYPLQMRYFAAVRDYAMQLTWEKLGPIATNRHELISAQVRSETHKPASYASFVRQFDQDLPDDTTTPPAESLKTFLLNRRTYLLNDPIIKGGSSRVILEARDPKAKE